MPTEYNPVKISQLPRANTLSDADLIPIVQAGVTKAATKAQLSVGLAGSTLTQIVNSVTSTTFVLSAGTYIQAIILTGNNGTAKVGTSAAGGQLLDDTLVTGTPLVYSLLPSAFFPAETTIYFTGTFKARLLLWLIGE